MMNNDRLESLLRSAGNSEQLLPETAPGLPERVLQIAAQRQTRRRRGIVVAGFVGCYLGGILTMWIYLASAATQTTALTQVAQGQGESPARTRPAPAGDLVSPESELPIEPLVAIPLHRDVSKPQKSLYELFRNLGDSNHASGDYPAAVRNYRLALDFASEADLRTETDEDNLLLLSLKRDRTCYTPPQNQGESI